MDTRLAFCCLFYRIQFSLQVFYGVEEDKFSIHQFCSLPTVNICKYKVNFLAQFCHIICILQYTKPCSRQIQSYPHIFNCFPLSIHLSALTKAVKAYDYLLLLSSILICLYLPNSMCAIYHFNFDSAIQFCQTSSTFFITFSLSPCDGIVIPYNLKQ